MEQEQSNPIDLVGQRIFGDYDVVQKLGEGGMGAVFLAKHCVIDQKIAIKVLHQEAASIEEAVERFNREARVISLLSHPNIIRVFVFGRTTDNLMYLAMEYVSGTSLSDYYRVNGFPDELTTIKIVKQICSALAEAHDLSIIHRDLKPENVLLTNFRGEEHYVKILDFGIAKMTEDEDQKRLTQAGIVYGTPDYLAPEQAMAQPLDSRSDIYSIGVMLFEMITGKLPFERSNVVQILKAHAFEQPPDPATFSERPVAPTMRHIILKCLQKSPAERYQNAMDLYQALEQREKEIIAQKNLKPVHVPGSEITSMFSAISPDSMHEHLQSVQSPSSHIDHTLPQTSEELPSAPTQTQTPSATPKQRIIKQGTVAPTVITHSVPEPNQRTQLITPETKKPFPYAAIFIGLLILLLIIALGIFISLVK